VTLIEGYRLCHHGAKRRGQIAIPTIRRRKGASIQRGGGVPMFIAVRSILLGCRELIAGSSGTDSCPPSLALLKTLTSLSYVDEHQ
jgi:hypothetical protein